MSTVGDRHCVLVVEDDAAMRTSLVELLHARGVDAYGVPHGGDAFHILRRGYPACAVVLDLDMPVMNGWTFMDVQREDPRLASIPVFVLTGLPEPAREAQRIGAVAGVAKGARAVGDLLSALGANCARH